MEKLNLKKELYISLIFLIVMLSGNFMIWQVTKMRLLDHSSTMFEEVGEDIAHLAKNRLIKLEEMLMYGRKFFEVSGQVDRSSFQIFYSQIYDEQKKELPGLRRISYIERVTDISAFVAKIRAEKAQVPAQYLFFSVQTDDTKKNHYIYNYFVPYVSGNKVFGTDFALIEGFSERLESCALRDAFCLLGPVNISGQNLLFLVYPVFDTGVTTNSKKIDNLRGFVTAVLEPENVFEGVFSYQDISEHLNIRAYLDASLKDRLEGRSPTYTDINDSTLLSDGSGKLEKKEEIEFAGRRILLHVESRQSLQLTAFERYFPDLIFFGGSIMILSFFIIMVSFKLKCEEESKPD